MSIETDYIEAIETQNLWKFISTHGCGEISVSSAEKMPEEALTNRDFLLYADIYEALQLAKQGDPTPLLKHGDGLGEVSSKNGVKLNPEINDHLFHYKMLSDTLAALKSAAAIGKVEWVKKCVEKIGLAANVVNEDINQAIVTALENGHVDVAQYLFEKGAKLYNVTLNTCRDEKTREWFSLKLREALHHSYPEPTYTLSPAAKNNQFFRWGEIVDFEHVERCIPPLHRAIELADTEFTQQALIKTTPENRYQALLFATKMKLLPMIMFLHEQGISLNPVTPFTFSALHEAIFGKDESAIDYILSNNINLNIQNREKLTPLMATVIKADEVSARKLLAKGADVSLTNVDGENALHIAAYENNPVMVKLLLETQNAHALLTQRNIYGKTPLDFAIQDKNDALIKLLAPDSDLEQIKKKPDYGFSPTRINQTKLIKKINRYLKLQNRSTAFTTEGYCNGLAFLYLIYAAQNKEDYYFDTLRLMICWDGDPTTLETPFSPDLPQARYYKNLKELFEQWINDITLFQATATGIKEEMKISYYDRKAQHGVIGTIPGLEPVFLLNEREHRYVVPPSKFTRSKEQLIEVLNYLVKMQPGCQFEIGGAGHAISGYKDTENKITLYDSNFDYKTTKIDDAAEVVNRIIDYKYILLGKYNSSIESRIGIFYFKKDEIKLQLDSFYVFNKKELPTSIDEANLFQSTSPNRFTHLHVAIMAHSLPVIHQLLDDGYCDMQQMHLGTVQDMVITEHTVQDDILDLFLTHPKTTNLEWLLIAAIRRADLPLVRRIVESKKVDINKTVGANLVLPLNVALFTGDESVTQFLIQSGANVLKTGRSFNSDTSELTTPLGTVISDYEKYKALYPLCMSQLNDPDQKDGKENAAIHYAFSSTRVHLDVFKDLLARGANPNILNNKGKHPFDILVSALIVRTKTKYKRKCIELFIPFLGQDKLSELLFKYTTNPHEGYHELIFPLLLETCQNKKMILNAPNVQGLSLLHTATMSKQFSKVEQLLKAGCDVDTVLMPSRNTLLISLVKYRNDEYPAEERYKLINLLLDHHANVTSLNANGESALDLVKQSDDEKLKAIFIQRRFIQAAGPDMSRK